jgi:hypothetical protein
MKPEDEIDGMDIQRPRAHHYLFAHQVLPSMVWDQGIKFIYRCKELDNNQWVEIWDDLGKPLEDTEGESSVSSEGLSAKYIESEKYIGIAITFPEPLHPPEAYFAYIVSKRPSFFSFRNKVRYFTLELMQSFKLNSRLVVICEWENGVHRNYGEGVEPELENFVNYVENNILEVPS